MNQNIEKVNQREDKLNQMEDKLNQNNCELNNKKKNKVLKKYLQSKAKVNKISKKKQ